MTTAATRWITSTNPDAPPDRLDDYRREAIALRRARRVLAWAAGDPAEHDRATAEAVQILAEVTR